MTAYYIDLVTIVNYLNWFVKGLQLTPQELYGASATAAVNGRNYLI